jgi:hypothetical protein
VQPIDRGERPSRASFIIRAALLGTFTGACSVAIVDGDVLPLMGWTMGSVAPGAIFGLVLGLAFRQWRLLRWLGVVSFGVAAALSHAVAFHSAVFMLGRVEPLLGRGSDASFAVTGAIAGAIGGGLLAAASAFLLPLGRWPWLVTVGALLGAFLPLGNHDDIYGIWLFYVIWQAGYAAALAVALSAAPGQAEAT